MTLGAQGGGRYGYTEDPERRRKKVGGGISTINMYIDRGSKQFENMANKEIDIFSWITSKK